jgi:hypothetical protein
MYTNNGRLLTRILNRIAFVIEPGSGVSHNTHVVRETQRQIQQKTVSQEEL